MSNVRILIAAAAVAYLLPTAGASALTYSVVHSFSGADGAAPYAALIEDQQGNLWGTTYLGGANSLGAVFKIAVDGTYTVVHSFANDGVDGIQPYAGLVEDKNGNLWGTTLYGGADSGGVVFEIKANGDYVIVHSFCSQPNCADGRNPYAGLTLDKKGNLWGTNTSGGADTFGTLYKIGGGGDFSVVHNFNVADGWYANGLILDKAGNLWGSAVDGGAGNYGSVFEFSASGTFSVVHSFCGKRNCKDGSNPYAAVAQDQTGKFWGTTFRGGANGNGTVFRMTRSGHYVVMHSFAGGLVDGSEPYSGVIQDKGGNIWGATFYGGAKGGGTLFMTASSGVYSVVHDFAGGPTDGVRPMSEPMQDSRGNIWGTTSGGGSNGDGVIFKITP